jgi:membrane-bound metal-dependent hydrolase YbcI (DUF457 family)
VQGPSHLMLSWYFAESAGIASARDRRIVAWSGLAPDVEVLAYAGAIVWYGFDKDRAFENVWQVAHRHYTHGIAFVLLTGIVAWWLASPGSSRARVAMFAMLASAIHNFCDLVGGGAAWPVYLLWPLSEFKWSAAWSWEIGDWPNLAILFGCLAGMFLYAKFAGRSPVECFGDRADAWFTRVVRQKPAPAAGGSSRLRVIIWVVVILVVAAVVTPLL